MNDRTMAQGAPEYPSKTTIEARQKRTTKIAYAPSQRQRMLTSKKADTLSGFPDRLYRGEDLKRGSR